MSSKFLDWDEHAVQEWLVKQGFEQGITGDVLALLDSRSLADLGVVSLGHRLGILRAVWELKLEQGVEVGEDEWRPNDDSRFSIASYAPSHSNSSHSTLIGPAQPSHYLSQPGLPSHARTLTTSDSGYSPTSTVDPMMHERMWDMIAEQNERIAGLEADIQKLLTTSGGQTRNWDTRDRQRDAEKYRDAFTNSENTLRSMGSRANMSYDDSSNRRPIRSPTRQSHSETTTPINPTTQFRSNGGRGSSTTPAQPPPLSRSMSATGMVAGTPHNQSFASGVHSEASTPLAAIPPNSTPASAANKSHISNASGVTLPSSISTTPATSAPVTTGSSSSAQKDAVSAAKSFKVTLDDPCWKVLPAALKKYKIIDDWRQYAMFICFGNTERCLSYDEKPLLLFQKLKEANQKPVFMLRHIRDIKSPIAVAQQKQAARNASRSAAGQAKGSQPTTAPAASTPGSSNPHPYSKDTRLHRPPVLQPISAKAKATAVGSGKTTPGSAGGQGTFPELPSPGIRMGTEGYTAGEEAQDGERKMSYAVAIYPYVAEREDEFDVTVGATFTILNKAKGWWVVQKDPDGTGATSQDESLSGWVPAGCLLELSRPIAEIGGKRTVDADGSTGTQPIPHDCVLSSSFPGIALMDYTKKGEDELDLKRDDLLRVFKRYNFYSYCILESTGARGWCPSWFISKVRPNTDGSQEASAKEESRSAAKGDEDKVS